MAAATPAWLAGAALPAVVAVAVARSGPTPNLARLLHVEPLIHSRREHNVRLLRMPNIVQRCAQRSIVFMCMAVLGQAMPLTART